MCMQMRKYVSRYINKQLISSLADNHNPIVGQGVLFDADLNTPL